jgi:hypothetical protein
VITAKPLRINRLRLVGRPTDSTKTSPEVAQNNSKTISVQSPIEIGRITNERITNVKNVLEAIVNNSFGLKANQAHKLMIEYYRREKLNVETYLGNSAAILKQLVVKNKITRVKINNVYYYYRRYNDDPKTCDSQIE